MAAGHGGRRPGSGAKKKNPVLRSIDGGAAKREVVPVSVDVSGLVPAGIESFEPSDELTTLERQVWVRLAPYAFQNRTLTKATAFSFELLCKNVVLERALANSGSTAGGADHRGIIQRVDAELLRFNLSPCGKAMYEPVADKPANPLERFLKRQA